METEVNGDSKSTNERDPSFVGSLDSSCRYDRFLFCLEVPVHYFNSFVPIALQAGQAGVLGRLSLCIWCQPSGRTQCDYREWEGEQVH